MNELPILREAFADELEKIAISMGRLRMPKARRGRRSMTVSTFLRKEKDGSLYKKASEFVDRVAARVFAKYQEDGRRAPVPPARPFRRTPIGEVPTRDDAQMERSEDVGHYVPRILGPGAMQNPGNVM